MVQLILVMGGGLDREAREIVESRERVDSALMSASLISGLRSMSSCRNEKAETAHSQAQFTLGIPFVLS